MVCPTCIEEMDEDHCSGQRKVSQVHTQIWDTSPEDGKRSTGFG